MLKTTMKAFQSIPTSISTLNKDVISYLEDKEEAGWEFKEKTVTSTHEEHDSRVIVTIWMQRNEIE